MTDPRFRLILYAKQPLPPGRARCFLFPLSALLILVALDESFRADAAVSTLYARTIMNDNAAVAGRTGRFPALAGLFPMLFNPRASHGRIWYLYRFKDGPLCLEWPGRITSLRSSCWRTSLPRARGRTCSGCRI